MKNITPTLERVGRAPRVSRACREGSRQGRKGQDTACLWGSVPGARPRPLLGSWWDLVRRRQGRHAVELSYCFGKLKAVGALVRGYLSALLSFLLSAAGLTLFSFIGIFSLLAYPNRFVFF